MIKEIKKLYRDTLAASTVEYGLLLCFIALVIIVGVLAFGTAVRGLYTSANDTFP